jgi:hypothetical protein
MSNRINHQEIVRKLIETRAIDFKAIGATFAEVAPAMALADEPWDGFCGTMRTFLRLYIMEGPLQQLEELQALRGVSAELRG